MREGVRLWVWGMLLVTGVALAFSGCGGDAGEPPPAAEPAAEPAAGPVEQAQPEEAALAVSEPPVAPGLPAEEPAEAGPEAEPAGGGAACCPAAKKCVALFDGTDLSGWQNAREPESENAWTIEDGAMTNVPHGNDIATKESYKDFCVCLEYKTVEGGNSGVYLRGRVEVQVFDSHGKEQVDTTDNGAIFGQTPPSVNASKPAGEWNALMACFTGDMLTAVLNGQVIHEKLKIAEVTGGALPGGVNDPGPLMLQGDHGKVWYRNIRLCPLKEGEECPMGAECPLMMEEGGAANEGAAGNEENAEAKSDDEELDLGAGGGDDLDEFDYSKGGSSKSTPPQ